MMTAIAVALAVGYLLGSIPFGLLLTRAAGLGDVRAIGSHSIGATNVLRTGNKKLAAATLVLDTLKGTAAVLLARWLATSMILDPFDAATTSAPGLAAGIEALTSSARAELMIKVASLVGGFGAFIGHIFPVWLGFKGGKGVATYIGILLGFAWPVALVFAAAWLVTAWLTRFSSLSALVATVIVFIYLVATGGPFVVPVAALISALLFWKHRENIGRLVAGTESKIGAKG